MTVRIKWLGRSRVHPLNMGSFWMAVRITLILIAIQNVWALGSLDGRWVDAWTAMPQLTEPANLPPPPFVSLFLRFVMYFFYLTKDD
jgi:hypothetical protein